MEDAFVCYFDTGMSSAKLLLLQFGQITTNLYDIVLRAFIDFRVFISKIIENVAGKSSISCSDFINDKVLVWEVL